MISKRFITSIAQWHSTMTNLHTGSATAGRSLIHISENNTRNISPRCCTVETSPIHWILVNKNTSSAAWPLLMLPGQHASTSKLHKVKRTYDLQDNSDCHFSTTHPANRCPGQVYSQWL